MYNRTTALRLTVATLFLAFAVLFTPSHAAKADTFCLGAYVTSAQGWNNCAYLYTVNIDKSVYNAGDTINVAGAVQSNVCANYADGTNFVATLAANINTNTSVTKTLVNTIPQVIETNGVFTKYGAPSSGSASFTAPSFGGSYAVHFVGTGQSFAAADPYAACFNSGQGGLACLATDPTVNTGTTTYDIPFSIITPTVTLTATPSTITSQGATSTLTWVSTNATSCVGSGFSTDGATTNVLGGVPVSPAQTTTYGITCTGAGGSATSTATVSVAIPAQPTATISGTGCTLSATSGSCSVVVSWAATSTTNGLVDISFISPGGTETPWWTGAPAKYSIPALATIAGTFTYKVYDHGTTNLLASTNVPVTTVATPAATLSGQGCVLGSGGAGCSLTATWKETNSINGLVDLFSALVSGGASTTYTGLPADPTQLVPVTIAGTYQLTLKDNGNALQLGQLLLAACPAGTANVNETCVCPNGSAPDASGSCSGAGTTGTTTPALTCTGGQVLSTDGTSCACPSGDTLVSGTCTPIPTCTGGQVLSATTNSCVCPNGQFLSNAGICVDSSCSANAGEPCSTNNSCANNLQTGTYGCDGATCSAPAPDESLCIPKAQLGFSASPASVDANQTTTLSWDATNVKDCSVSGQSVSVSSTAANSNNEVTGSVVTASIQGSTVYTLTCHNLGGASVSQSITVKLIPTVIEK